MTALAKDRNTQMALGDIQEYPMLATALGYTGGMAVLDSSGWCKPAVTATGLVCVGRFETRADNSLGANGAINGEVRAGIFKWANSSSTDEITKAEIGDNCFIVDDQTVAKTDGTGTRSIAGRVMQVDTDGVWVQTGLGILNAPGGALLASNNLSDLGTPATARTNLAVDEGMGTPTIVVGSEGSNAINVTIQLKTKAGVDLAVRGSVFAYLSDDANGDTIAGTAPDGGVAIGTDGLAIPIVANKAFQLVSEADGDIDITITESSVDTWYLILVMPNGRLVVSDAITFA